MLQTSHLLSSRYLLYPFAESLVPIIIYRASFIGMNLEKFHKLISYKMLRRFHSKSNHIPIFKKGYHYMRLIFIGAEAYRIIALPNFRWKLQKSPHFFLLIIFSRYTSFLVTFNFHSYYFDFYRMIDSINTLFI